jgi:hypothetical protein
MARYEFEPHAFFLRRDEADAQVIGEVLEQLTRENGGRLKGKHLVEAARKRGHPLHRHFEWDDRIAAEAYRLDQANALIRSIRIIAEDEVSTAARAYHAINDDGTAYRSSTEIATSALLQLALHRAALRDLIAWENRYRSIATIYSMIKVAREQLEETIATMHGPPTAPEAPPSRKRRGTNLESRPTT